MTAQQIDSLLAADCAIGYDYLWFYRRFWPRSIAVALLRWLI